MSKRDYYETLGVPRGAGPSDIKSAFRQLARKYHPDVSKETDAEERFKEINEAYAVLSDDQKRAAYDRYGHAGLNGAGGIPTDFDFSDIFEELFGFGMGGFGRSRGGSRSRARKGSNLQHVVTLSFEEAAFGIKKEIAFNRDETCSHCKGSRAEPGSSSTTCTTCGGQGEVRQARQTLLGQMVQVTTCPSCRGVGQTIDQPCTQCRGQGIERNRATKNIEVPAGVDHGTQIRLSGEGQPGSNGGPNGDLFVLIQVKNHKFFRRKDFDILLDLDINIAQATLGAEVDVPTLDGDTKLKIPAGIQAGKVLRMRNKGVPYLRREGRGDQMVIVNVVTPTKLDEEQRELMEKLAESLGTEVFPAQDTFLDRLRDILGG